MSRKESLLVEPPVEVAESYRQMEKYFKIATKMNALPFHYNKQRRRFSLDRNSQKYKIWLVVMLLGMFLESLQVTAELLRGLADPTMKRGQWSLVLFIFISWVFIFSCHVNVYFYGEDIASYINQVLGTREYLKESNLPPTNDHKVVKAHIYISCSQCFFQALMVAAEGFKAQYIFSNVPDEYKNPITWGMWIPYAYYRVASNFQAGYFQYFVGILHVQTCNQIMRYRRIKKETPEQGLKSYRMVQLITKRYICNFAFSRTFIPSITIFAASNIILGNYGTLRFIGELEFNLYANFPLMASMMLLLVITFFPENATVKQVSETESIRTLFSCLNMENELDKFQDAVAPIEAPDVAPEIEQSAPALADLVMRARRPTIVVSTRDDEAAHSEQKLKKFGALFQQKVDNMLDKIHRYKMAKSFAMSCPCVSVGMAGFYPIKQSTVLSLFEFILGNTISALLTWN